MKNLLLLLACLLIFSCAQEKKVKNDLTRQNLNGNIKSITYYTYNAVEKVGIVEKDSLSYCGIITYNNIGFLLQDSGKCPGKLSTMFINKYDANNNIVEHELYKEGMLSFKKTKKYDDKNKVIEEITFEHQEKWPSDSLEKDEDLYANKYDNKENLIEVDASRNGKPWYIEHNMFDDKGNIVKQNLSYSWSPKSDNSGVFKYDENGNQLEKDCFDYDGKSSYKFTNKYNDKGNKTDDKIEYKDTLVRDEVIIYDDHGNVTSCIDYRRNSVIKSDSRFEYKKFDSKGNWIEQVSYENGKPETITERTIEYY